MISRGGDAISTPTWGMHGSGGVPDWSCEILSRGHEKRDRVDKLGTLHRAGVPYYWIVNHDEKILEIYRNEPAGFVLIMSAGSGEAIRAEPFDAVELRTSVIFGDEDDVD